MHIRGMVVACGLALAGCGSAPSSPQVSTESGGAWTVVAPPEVSGMAAVLAADPVRWQLASEALRTLEAQRAALGLGEGTELSLRSVAVDRLGQAHARFRQSYRGVPVLGGALITHTSAGGVALSPTVALTRPESLLLAPALDARRAIDIAEAAHPAQRRERASSAELVLFPRRELVPVRTVAAGARPNARDFAWVVKEHMLSFLVHTEPLDERGARADRDLLVDARDGSVLRDWPSLETALGHSEYAGDVTLTTRPGPNGHALVDGNGCETRDLARGDDLGPSVGGTLYLDADDVWGDGKAYAGGDTTAANGQTAAVDAAWGLAQAWRYFEVRHGWVGADGAGTPIPARVHAGTAYENAFYDPGCACLTFGDGEGRAHGGHDPLTALDIVAHELTHGVTYATAGLDYAGEAGGLNEATSDIFGTLVEFEAEPRRANWTQGEQVGAEPFRWMYRPSLDGSSLDYWMPNLRFFNPHYASGPMNRAFFFLSEGASAKSGADTYSTELPRGMRGIGRAAAGEIWFRALAVYLTAGATYLDARAAALMAAEDLHGHGSTAFQSVQNAFAAIAVGGPAGADEVSDLVAPVGVTAAVSGSGEATVLSASAHDGRGVMGVDMLVDGNAVGRAWWPPFALPLDPLLTPGPHTLSARALDDAGNARLSAPVSFTYDDPTQLLVNPGFEEGSLGWTASPGTLDWDAPGWGLRGAGLALLGGRGVAGTSSLSQTVTVPAGGATLGIPVMVFAATDVHGTFTVSIVDGGVEQAIGSLTSADGVLWAYWMPMAGPPPYQLLTFDLAPWAGRSVELRLSASEDGAGLAAFLVDEVWLRTPASGDVTPPRATCHVENNVGKVLLLLDARDPSGVTSADFAVDGAPVVASANRLAVLFDSTALGDGDHQVQVTVRDAVGNAASCLAPLRTNNGLEVVQNGGFESVVDGQATGWTVAGAAAAGTARTPSSWAGSREATLGGAGGGVGTLSQVMDVPDGLSYTLGLDVKVNTTQPAGTDVDFLRVYVTDAATGQNLNLNCPSCPMLELGNDLGWWPGERPNYIPLGTWLSEADLAGRRVLLQIRSDVTPDGLTSFNVDNVSLRGYLPSPPPAAHAFVARSPHAVELHADASNMDVGSVMILMLDGERLDSAQGAGGLGMTAYLAPALLGPGAHTFQVIVRHGDLQEAQADATFTVDEPLPDDDTPVVTAAAVVDDTSVTLDATATDAAGVSGVDFFLDGKFLLHQRAAPYHAVLDRSKLGGGGHRVEARAYDGVGRAGKASATFQLPGGGGGGCSSGGAGALWAAAAALVTLGRVRRRSGGDRLPALHEK